METFSINLQWKNDKEDFVYEQYSRRHTIQFNDQQKVEVSAAPTYLGDSDRCNPELLFAASISSCHMLTFLALAAKIGFHVESYEDDAVAFLEKIDKSRSAVSEVVLHPVVKFLGTPPDQERLVSLHDVAHHNCFIAQSVKTKISISI